LRRRRRLIVRAASVRASRARTEIDVLADAEAEVARRGEVLLPQLVLLHLQATLEDLLRLLAAHANVARDLLVPTNAELANSVARLLEDGLLSAELLEHLGGAGETIATLADGDVEDQLLDLQLAHDVLILKTTQARPGQRGRLASDSSPKVLGGIVRASGRSGYRHAPQTR
jgi:hypothetical protein